KNRLIGKNAKIGFHQPSMAGLSDYEQDELARGEERRLMSFGLSPQFAHRASEVRPSDMWIPSPQELVAENVATRIVDTSKFALSGFTPSEITIETADKLLRDVPAYQAIAQIDNDSYQKIRAQVFDGLQKGKSASEISLQVSPIVDELFERALPHT